MSLNEILDDLMAECPCDGAEYCPAEAFLRGIPERVIRQHKCVEMLKYMESKAVGRDVGWERAYELWAERGHAKKFADVYKDGMKHRDLFKAVTGVDLPEYVKPKPKEKLVCALKAETGETEKPKV